MAGRRGMLAAAGLSAAGAALHPVAAQSVQDYQAFRAIRSERRLDATIAFSGGDLFVSPAAAGELYRMELRYDPDRVSPVQRYDTATATLDFGVAPAGSISVDARPAVHQLGRFTLATTVPVNVTLDVQASHATIDLGGLMLSSLAVQSTATDATIDFSRPASGRCESASFTLAAGQLEVRHMAQAGCAAIRVNGAAGGVTLAFDGTWQRNPEVTVGLTMGRLGLVVPRGIGVRIRGDRFLSPFQAEGFVPSDGGWETPGFAGATRRLTVTLKTSMVGVDVRWVAP